MLSPCFQYKIVLLNTEALARLVPYSLLNLIQNKDNLCRFEWTVNYYQLIVNESIP